MNSLDAPKPHHYPLAMNRSATPLLTAEGTVIVLTCSISPSANAKVARSDPALRLDDYLASFEWWMTKSRLPITKFLVIENSGFPLEAHLVDIRQRHGRHDVDIELVSTPAIPIPPGHHYGWGEAHMLDLALKNSRLFAGCTHMVKATGRLLFPDIAGWFSALPAQADMVIDCRIPLRVLKPFWTAPLAVLKRQEAYASTQLFLCSRRFYEQELTGLSGRMGERQRRLLEDALYADLMTADQSGKYAIRKRFPTNCEPIGFGGALNNDYQSRKRSLTASLRQLLRPTGIWI